MMNSRKPLIRKLPKWNKIVLMQESELRLNYALRNKRELQRVYYELSRIRRVSSELDYPKMYEKLIKTGIIKMGESVLSLTTTSFLERRLQTILTRMFSVSLRQSRQLIAHGHVLLNGKVLRRSPSQVISLVDEVELSIRPKTMSTLGINRIVN
jgi:ribosomal protein S4